MEDKVSTKKSINKKIIAGIFLVVLLIILLLILRGCTSKMPYNYEKAVNNYLENEGIEVKDQIEIPIKELVDKGYITIEDKYLDNSYVIVKRTDNGSLEYELVLIEKKQEGKNENNNISLPGENQNNVKPTPENNTTVQNNTGTPAQNVVENTVPGNPRNEVEIGNEIEEGNPEQPQEPQEPEVPEVKPTPVISLNGNAVMTMYVGEIYIEPGYTAADDKDGDITSKVIVTSDLDVTIAGEYYISYTVTNSSGNSITVKRSIKVIEADAPSLTLNGDVIIYLEYPQAYLEPGFTAIDPIDGDITSSVIVTGTVDTSVLGSYEIEYKIVNSFGKETIVTRTVVVQDTTAPVIVVKENIVQIGQSSQYNPLDNIIVTDNYTAPLNISFTSVPILNLDKAGTYEITYVATDSSGNKSTAAATIIVNDTTKPVITVNTPNISVVQGTTVDLLDGVSASDDVDGDLTSQITFVSLPIFDPDVADTYIVTYDVTDSAGNHADSVTKTIVVTPDTVIPDGTITYSNTNPTNQNVTATLQTNKPIKTPDGWTKVDDTTFTKIYEQNASETILLEDKYGKMGTVDLDILNIDKVAPVITVANSSVVVTQGSTINLLDGVTASDNVDGDITANITYISNPTFDVNTIGTYTITYSVIDSAGNEAIQKQKYITVSEVIIPTADVVYIPDVMTKDDVVARMITSTEIDTPIGWTRIDATTYEKTYNQNITETITIKDKQNVEGSVIVSVINIDKVAPIISVGTDLVTISQGEDINILDTVTASDNIDGDITTNITYTSSPEFNKSIAGTYVFTYHVLDGVGNAAEPKTKTVVVQDIGLPVITVQDDTNVYEMEVFGQIPTFNATAVDGVGKQLDVLVDTSGVLPNVIGEYTVKFTATDDFGHSITVERTLKVVDKIAPVITLNGNETIYLEAKVDSYIEPGAVVTDNYDTSVQASLQIVGDVNPNIIGEYNITYTAKDSSNNETSVQRKVIVRDTLSPTLIVNPLELTLNIDSVWNYKDGVSASDIYDGDLTNSINYTQSVDFGTVGDYEIYYIVSDSSGNTSNTITRTVRVRDIKPPVITLDDSNVYTHEVFSPKPVIKATAVDEFDNIVTNIVIDDSLVNMNVIGSYPVVITATDSLGKSATTTVMIEVIYTAKPVITLVNENIDITLEVGTAYVEPGYSATSTYYGDITSSVLVNGSVNENEIGTYELIYTVTDSSNNTADIKKRTIHVVDTQKPVITLRGDYTYTLDLNAEYVEPGASVSDNYDLDIQTKLVITNNIDKTTKGQYTVYYNATDSSGNVADEVTRTVIVEDISKPVITVKNPVVEIAIGSVYDPVSNIEVTDNSGEYVDVSYITNPSPFVTDSLQTYEVIYTATDTSGNTETATAVIIVKDLVLPVIHVEEPNISIHQGEDIDLLDRVTASDNVDGDLTDEIIYTVEPAFDKNTAGIYVVTYHVTDSSLNEAEPKTKTITVLADTLLPEAVVSYDPTTPTNQAVTATMITNKNIETPDGWTKIDDTTFTKEYISNIRETVIIKDLFGKTANVEIIIENIDTTSPVITVNTPEILISRGEEINLLDGVSATDDLDGDLTSQIIVVSNPYFDNETPGSYLITYLVSDRAGNEAEPKTKTIIVESVGAPTIVIDDVNNIYESEVHKPSFTKFKATATDEFGRTVSVKIDYSAIQVNKLGTYEIIFTATDDQNRTTKEIREYKVIDKTAPEIILNGLPILYLQVGTDKYIEPGAIVIDNYDNKAQDTLEITGSVNTNQIGTYTITYTAKDGSGNIGTNTRIVVVEDNIAPVLSVIPTRITIEVNSSYNLLEGVSALDNYDGDISALVSYTGNIDLTTVGTYTLEYFVNDSSGNQSNKIKRIIDVVAMTPPTIILDASNIYKAEVFSPIPDIKATAKDKNNQEINPVIIDDSAVNMDIIGSYPVIITATDEFGTTATTTVLIDVVNTSLPIISLVNEGQEIILNLGESYIEPGYSANSVYYGDLSSSVIVSGVVNINTVGTYTLTYSVKDASNNVAVNKTRTIKVVDIEKPVITLLGDADITMELGESYTDAGVLVSDNYDLDIKSKLVITNNLNTNIAGSYEIKYNVKDSSGNAADEVVRRITVVNTKSPVITLKSSILEVEVYDDFDPLSNITVTDASGEQLNISYVSIPSGFNTNSLQTYEIIYTAVNQSGNSSQDRATIHVVDSTKPVITVNDPEVEIIMGESINLLAGVTATDNYNGDITDKITYASNPSFDPNKAGSYKITYTATDTSGNIADEKTKVVTVIDLDKPVITVDDVNNIYEIEVYENIPSHFVAHAKDSFGVPIDVAIDLSSIDNTTVGTYEIRFTATDGLGNTLVVTRDFKVVDKTKPVITLNGNTPYTIKVGENYQELGAVVTDNYDQTVQDSLEIVGNVDNQTPGTYEIKYRAKDSSGNIAQELTRTVVVVDPDTILDDTEPPVISVFQPNVTITVGENVNLLDGVVANDNKDGNITDRITYTSSPSFDQTKPGSYLIKYNVVDSSGNSAIEKTKTITVIDGEHPTIFVLDVQNIYEIEVFGDIPDQFFATAVDYLGNPLDVVVDSGFIIYSEIGTYEVTFTATDSLDKTTIVTREFKVVDTTKPVISLIGNPVISVEVNSNYIDQGVTISDNYDLSIESSLQVTNTVNTAQTGIYEVIYNVADQSGNRADQVIRTVYVIDSQAPSITLKQKQVNINLGENYDPLDNIIVTDNSNIAPIATFDSDPDPFDYNTAGSYQITYTAVDESGKMSQDTCEIVVIDTQPPVITVLETEVTIIQGQSVDILAGVSLTDNDDPDIDKKLTYTITPELDIHTIGKYVVTFEATDRSGNSAIPVTKTINVIKGNNPIITVLDAQNIYEIEVFGDIPDVFGATALDAIGNSLDVVVNKTQIDNDALGTYIITFTAVDSYGNETIETREFKVVDTTDPLITLIGSDPVIIEAKRDIYIEPGFIATDNYDSQIQSKVVVEGTVDTNTIGSYPITYTVTDSSGNTHSIGRTVNVVDTISPKLTVNPTEITIEENSNYDLNSGITAIDNYDGDISALVTYTGFIDITVPGRYTLEYVVLDSSGNESNKVTRIINVEAVTPPTIRLDESNIYQIEVFSQKPIIKAIAIDEEGTEVSDLVIDDSAVNPNVIGTYPVVITATDQFGRKATTTVNIEVIYTVAPVIDLVDESAEFVLEGGSKFVEPGYSGTSSYYGDITSKIVVNGIVNEKEVGTYTLIYTLVDESNNVAISKSRVVKVVDTTKPVITLVGESEVNAELKGVYKDLGVKVADNIDTDIQSKLEVTSNVDTTKLGSYNVVYTVTDNAGNVADPVTRIVNVVDTTKPKITIKDKNLSIDQGDTTVNVLDNVSATDNADTDIIYSFETNPSPLDVDVIRSYDVTYFAQDASGNIAEASGKITIKDKTAPVIMVESPEVTITQGEEINVLDGVSANDNIDGDITKNIKYTVVPNLNTLVEGEYIVSYNVKDANGNAAVTETKKIIVLKDETAPIGEVTYEMKVATEVIAKLTTNEKIITPNGWVKVNDKTFTKVYKENIKEILTIEDLFGNKADIEIDAKGILPKGWVGIYTANQLYSIGNVVNYPANKQYILMNDIDINDATPEADEYGATAPEGLANNWVPAKNFSGQLDGNGFTIRGLKINRPGVANQGLFANTLSTSIIKNITLDNVDINAGAYTGGIAGTVSGTVSNVIVSGSIKSNSNYAGGIGGDGNNLTLSKVVNNADVIATGNNVGGLVGYLGTGTITLSYASGNVSGNSRVGGLIGYLYSNNQSISKCYASGNVSGVSYIGGFIGYAYTTGGTFNINNSFACGDVSGSSGYVAGFIGREQAYSTSSAYKMNIVNTYSLGKVQTTGTKGGFLSYQYASSYITNKNNYWVVNTSGVFTSLGASGLSVENATKKASFNTWDFNSVWSVNEQGEDQTTPYIKGLMIPEKIYVKNLEFLEGSGSDEDPFLIYNEDQLYNIRDIPQAHYKIMKDITIAKYDNWLPINNFSGSLDGNNHSVTGLKIDRLGTSSQGLFGSTVAGSSVNNLKLLNVDIKGGSYTGAVVGNSSNMVINNVHVTGKIQSNGNYTGAIAGRGIVNIQNSSSNVNIVSTSGYIGGIVGYLNSGQIILSYSTGNIEGGNYTAGLVGCVYGDLETNISKCYSTSNIKSTGSYVGGLIGRLNTYGKTVNVNNSFATGNIEAVSYVGGLIGYQYSYSNNNVNYKLNVSNVYSLGTVKGSSIGGLVGVSATSTYITNTNNYWIGNTSKIYTSARGSLLSIEEGSVADSYKTWDFGSIWEVSSNPDNLSLAYLKGLPIPDKVYLSNLEFRKGNGTENDPFLIYNEDDLDAIRQDVKVYYKLANDIDVTTRVPWTPIPDLTGGLDGAGYKITGLKVNKTGSYTGALFTRLMAGSKVKNLTLENIDVTGSNYTGGLAGRVYTSVIDNVHVTGKIVTTGSYYTGGIAGYSIGDIINCSSDTNITTPHESVGGIVGYQSAGSVKNSHYTGELVGGIYMGGIIGRAYDTVIENCYTDAVVKGSSSNVGGIAGRTELKSTITLCYAKGKITGTAYLGGLVGYVDASAIVNITKSYSEADVTGTSNDVGGFVGRIYTRINTANISNCYAVGNVTGVNNVGGFIGYEYAPSNSSSYRINVSNCYSLGVVSGKQIGGFLGLIGTYKTYITNTNCYWISNAAKVYVSDAGTSLSVDDGIIKGSYKTWDFTNIWDMSLEVANPSMPYIKELPIPDKVYVNNLEYGSGTGTAADPFLIYSEADLLNINNIKSGHYKIMNDIYLTEENWTPIVGFNGNLNGNGKTISGLKINRASTTNTGFFGTILSGGVVSDLTFEDVNVLGGQYTGALVGNGTTATINNVTVKGKVESNSSYVGGIAGNYVGNITDSHFEGDVKGAGNYAGGLIGYLNGGNISGSSSKGTVTGVDYTGGLIASTSTVVTSFTDCFSESTVIGSTRASGLIGYASGATLLRCHSTGNVRGNGAYTAGIIGYVQNSVQMTLCYATGDIENTTGGYAGGTIGYLYCSTPSIITKCYASGDVVSTANYSGGFVGRIRTNVTTIQINNSYAAGSVSGVSYIGGFCGEAYTSNTGATYVITMSNSYSLGSVSGTSLLGGFVGSKTVSSYLNASNCYWIREISGQSISAMGSPLSTTQAIKQVGYNTWDFDTIWANEKTDEYITTAYLKELPVPEEVKLRDAHIYEGEGTIDNPFLIYNETDFTNMRNAPELYFKMMNDITLTSIWEPIMSFTGGLDGNNHNLKGLAIDRLGIQDTGLFGTTSNTTMIKDLNIENADVKGGKNTGILVGSATGSNITNVKVSGMVVSNSDSVGGLIGLSTSVITDCSSVTDVNSTTSYVGGLVGYANGGSITNSNSTKNVTGISYVGGLVGGTNTGVTITKSYSSGNITGTTDVGGFVGYAIKLTATECYSNAQVTGNASSSGVGGFIGLVSAGGSVNLCYATGEVKAASGNFTGGFIGYIYSTPNFTVENSYATGNIVSGANYVGGFIGRIRAYSSTTLVQNCFSTGDATGASYVGGFLGSNYTSSTASNYIIRINNVYSIGKPAGTTIGGLVGVQETASSYLTNSNTYWIEDTSGQSTSVFGTKLNAIQAIRKDYYNTWNFTTIWDNMDANKETTPYLRNLPIPERVHLKEIEFYQYEGLGTLEDPYKIYTTEDLNRVRDIPIYHFILMNDLDLKDINWIPIPEFAGHLHGNDKTIANLTVDRLGVANSGLFANTLTGSSIENLTLKDFLVKGGQYVGALSGNSASKITNVTANGKITNNNNYAGGLVGYSTAEISNCKVDVIIESTGSYIAAIAGYATTGDIIKANVKATISGASYVGGISGRTDSNQITDCNADVSITSTSSYIGGLVGYKAGGKIENSYAKGNITGASSYAGGLVGRSLSNNQILKCYSTVDLTGTGSRKGGLIGQIESGATLTDSYASGNVNGASYIGGAIGYITTNADVKIDRSYASGNVTATANEVGGFIGYAETNGKGIYISDCYAVGDATGVNDVGGFLGNAYSANLGAAYVIKLTNVYSSGKVTGTIVGGLVGLKTASSYITDTNCYWLIESSGIQTSSMGSPLVTPLATTKDSYTNWDFQGIWDIVQTGQDKTTPYLKDLMIPDKVYLKNIEYYELQGTGTAADPFLILNENDLSYIRNLTAYHFRLENDITITNLTPWIPIENFAGSLDGNNKVITGLKVQRASIAQNGLFGSSLAGSSIKDLTIQDVSIQGGDNTGALIGNSKSDLTNIRVTGTITGNGNYVGGLVGTNSSNMIQNCTTNVTINNTGGYTAGLIGYNTLSNSNINNCSVEGTITGTSYVAGLVGQNNTNISNSHAKVDLIATSSYIGGLVGYQTGGTIDNCYTNVNTSGASGYVGGLIGRLLSNTTVKNCYSIGTLKGNGSRKGGLFGQIESGGVIDSCYTTCSIEGASYVGGAIGYASTNVDHRITKTYATGGVTATGSEIGGFIGRAYTSGKTLKISDCFSTGDVKGGTTVGGFIGYAYASAVGTAYNIDISNVYSSGKVTGTTIGGLVATKTESAYVTAKNSYWIIDNSGVQTSSMGEPIIVRAASNKSTFVDWDFNSIWDIIDTGENMTMPYLREMVIPEQVYVSRLDYYKYQGTGTAADPFLIQNQEDLNNIRTLINYHYKIEQDIIMTNTWEPIADFTGSIDGNGKTITGLTINKLTSSNVGLFSNISAGAEIKDLILESVNVKGNDSVGVIAGTCTGTLNSITVSGVLESNGNYVGGLVGKQTGGSITNSKADVGITAKATYVGGLVGETANTTITKSMTKGNISGTASYVGGLVGRTTLSTNIDSCYSQKSIAGVNYLGGLIGGISGNGDSTITKSYASGSVNGTNSDIGGFVGRIETAGKKVTIKDAFAVGNVTGVTNVGGFAGNVYSGSTAATYIIGLENVYSTGKVKGTTSTGGLVGLRTASSYITATNSYWIIDISGNQTSSMGSPIVSTLATTKLSYANWDFESIWGIVDYSDQKSLPYLNDIMIPDKVYLSNLEYHPKEGTGTIEDPFLVYTEDDLNEIRNLTSYHYRLMNDITISKYLDWEPIVGFAGTLDGNNKKIINLSINKKGVSNVGLFSTTVAGSKIFNLTLENINVKGGANTGGLVGTSYSVLDNIKISGMIESDGAYVGGMVRIKQCEYI